MENTQEDRDSATENVDDDNSVVQQDRPTNQHHSTTGIHSLPQEMLLLIFSYLSKHDLMDSVSRVSREWELLHRDASLYRALVFDARFGNAAVFLEYVNFAKRLESLRLVNAPNDNVILQQVCDTSTDKFRTLELWKSMVLMPELTDSTLMTFIDRFPRIHTFSIKGPYILSDVIFENLCIKLPYLKVVHFIALDNLTHEKIMSFAKHCPRLEELMIYRNMVRGYDRQVTVEEVAALCARVYTTLRVLYIDTHFYSSTEFECVVKCQKLNDLKFLVLLTCGLSFFGLMPNLRHIQITWTRAPDTDWILMCGSKALMNLESLCIHGWGMNDAVALVISTNLKNLRKLSLCFGQSTKLSYVGLVKIYEGCSKLEFLKLQWVKGFVYKSILQLPTYLPGLLKLSIFPEMEENKCDIEVLKSEMPNLVISHVFENA